MNTISTIKSVTVISALAISLALAPVTSMADSHDRRGNKKIQMTKKHSSRPKFNSSRRSHNSHRNHGYDRHHDRHNHHNKHHHDHYDHYDHYDRHERHWYRDHWHRHHDRYSGIQVGFGLHDANFGFFFRD